MVKSTLLLLTERGESWYLITILVNEPIYDNINIDQYAAFPTGCCLYKS